MTPKHALIIAAGAADDPLDALDGRTPIEAAVTPTLDEIATIGRQGTVRSIPGGFIPARDVATLTLLGCDVRAHYCGFAGLEVAARRLTLAEDEVAFRCNLATVREGLLVDHAAGHIGQPEAERLFSDLDRHFAPAGLRFYPGLSYRGLMVTRHPWATGVTCSPAHDVLGMRADRHLPSGRGSRELRQIMARAAELLADHEVNRVREDLNENPANTIWPWGQGVLPRVRRFRERFGLRGALVGAAPLIRGIAVLYGWPVVPVPGATGAAKTDFEAKGRAAVDALESHDLVVVHVEAPDDASLSGDLGAKLRAIEQIDRHIVAPLFQRLRRRERWSLLFVPDVATHLLRRAHTAEPVPFAIAGSAPLRASDAAPFGESAARRSDLHVEHGHDLLEYFLRT
ncbi:MAG: 2,3-bisphosphoglycerate-independent phosphoglycerate mutase [Phycisphaerae bacterium]|nr:2,3-bisphosphoglycerate-independent phosphoglycerate mutase [Phycisphaerae bacterium]